MSTTLAEINALINDRRRDSTSNTIDMTGDGFRAINSVLDLWSQSHDWPWTIKDVKFNYNSGIDWYSLDTIASDFKTPLTLKPYKNENKSEEFWMVAQSKFDSAQTKTRRFAITDMNGKQYLRMNAGYGNKVSVHTATQYNNDGTWVGDTAISNVSTDEYEGFELPTSVKFDYSGTSGTLTNSTMTSVDLNSYADRSNLYLDLYIPEVENFTSVTIKFGSGAGDYYQITTTTDYLGETPSEDNEWYRFKFSWNSPTTVGSPDITAIDYIQITLSYSVDQSATGFRIQNIFISENVPVVLTYYSNNMVYDVSAGIQTAHFTDSGDTTDYPLWSGKWDVVTEAFINSVLEIIFFMTGEYTDFGISKQKINEIVEDLKQKHPSRRRKPATFITVDLNY